jgi:drug/metabolite transporter (DMT)-like permease
VTDAGRYRKNAGTKVRLLCATAPLGLWHDMASNPKTSSAAVPSTISHGSLGGILLIVSAVLCFSCMDASAKWLGRTVNPLQTIAARYLISFFAVTLFFNPIRRPGIVRTRNLRLQCGRALCLVAATLSGFTAVRFMPLTKLTSITFAAPLIVAVLAGPLIGEKIGPRRVVAVCVGFIGVLVVTRPFGGEFHPATILAAIAAGANALYSILTRRLAAYDQPETTMFYTGLAGSLLMLPVLPFIWRTPATLDVWLVTLALGLFGALAHWLLILAHKRAAATALAPFYYVQLLGAVLLGVLIFGEFPDRWTIVGSAIVTGSGLYLVYRERVRHTHPSMDLAA